MSGLEALGPRNCITEDQSLQSPEVPTVDAPTNGLSIEELRNRNPLHSPLLRLPHDILTYILPFTMDNTKLTHTWTTILLVCHYLRKTIMSTPLLWGRIYCLPPETMLKRFEMADWGPVEIYAHVLIKEGKERVKAGLDSVRDAARLRRDRIHTLEFHGEPDVWPHFSWIFDEPLPNLKHLSISTALYRRLVIPPSNTLSGHLQALSISDIATTWPSHLFSKLKDLHMEFSSSFDPPGNQLITALKASPHLETLSLKCRSPNVLPQSGWQSNRIVELSHLKSLRLVATAPESIFVLTHLKLPAITSLDLDSGTFDLSHLHHVLSGGILPKGLFEAAPNSPYFMGLWPIRIGGLRVTGSRSLGDSELREILLPAHEVVPLSATTLEITQDHFRESHWREFARLRPEVHSISSAYKAKNSRSIGLWRALMPNKNNPSATLFPKLETVVLKAEHLSMIPRFALDCLRVRSEVGFRLKRLEVHDGGMLRHIGRQPEVFRSLADVYVYCETPINLREDVDT